MVMYTTTNMVYMLGPGNYELTRSMPLGTQQFQCSLTPSGHIMRPCAELPTRPERQSAGGLELAQQLALPVTQASTVADTPAEARPHC